MPRKVPEMRWDQIRSLMEKFEWKDPKTQVTVTGFNVPQKAQKTAKRKSVFIKYITLDGRSEQGVIQCLKVFLHGGKSGKGAHQRMIRFVESGEIRRICDILIIEIDGIKIV